MKVVLTPPIQFKCSACGATNEGGPEEFYELHTVPPTFRARCACCSQIQTCSPTVLIARTVGRMLAGG